MEKMKLGVLVGSVRKGSYSQSVARYLAEQLTEDFSVEFISIAALPLYNQDWDDEGTPPPEWETFRQQVKGCDAFLFVTPEYNRSMPPMMKNALDVASRPPKQNVWDAKPGAVVSVSPGAQGGFGANHHLRQSAACLNLNLMAQPEVYIGGVHKLLDEDGKLANEGTGQFLQQVAGAFTQWVRHFVAE